MSLDKSGGQRLTDVENDVRDLREFAASVKGGLRLLVAVQGLLLAGIAYVIWQGFPHP
jgi:hypothetical protein